MSEVQLSIETVLAVVIASQGGRVKIPATDFKTNLEGKVIAIDTINEGRVIVLSLVDGDEVNYED